MTQKQGKNHAPFESKPDALRRAGSPANAVRRVSNTVRLGSQHTDFGIGAVVEFPREATLATLFAAQVDARPAATALIHNGDVVTYSALNRLADAIAHRLIAKGVHQGDVVGVSLERSPLLVACMLGVLRLGAAYLPLAPSYPAERLRYIAENSRATAILTTRMLSEKLGYANALVLDDLDEAEIAATAPLSPVVVDPLAAAYIAYTSGSTGQPKGVIGTHSAAVNRFSWMWRTFPFASDEVMCQKTAISFVDSVWEIFGPLLAGVPQVIIDNPVVRDPAELLATLGEQRVTRLLVVPSLLKTIVDAGFDIPGKAPQLRYLFASGERLPKGLAQGVLHAAPGVTLVNLYGSSEVAADVTVEVVRVLDTDEVPIGRPIDNARLYVLNEERQHVRPGEAGELYVGGDVLAAGYLHRPDLTAERFLPDPFTDVPNALMFATGDRVNWLPDGRLMFRGRMDQQVKIRGARVELGEVEATLAGLPGVAEAVVLAQTDSEGDTRLVAFATGRDGIVLNGSALRTEMAKHLPDYMVPFRITALNAMPLNPNGKTDRTALSALKWQPAEDAHDKPANEIEAELHQIWSRLLGLPSIGIQQDYFALGGHSLMAVKMFAAVKARFGVDLPIAILLVNPTIRSLAALLSEKLALVETAASRPGEPMQDEPWDTTAMIHPGPGNGAKPLFIVGGVGGNVNHLFELGKAVGKCRPLIGLQTRGVMGHNLHESFEATAADHIANIRRHQPEGPYLIAGYSGGSLPAYEMARQLEAAGESVGLLCILDMYAPGFKGKVSFSLAERLRRELQSLVGDGIGMFFYRLRLKLRDKIESGWFLNYFGRFKPEYTRLRRLSHAWGDLETRYKPGVYDGDMTLFLAEANGVFARMMLNADPHLGWSEFVRGKLNVTSMHGNHFDIIVGKQAEALVSHMEAAIATAAQPRNSVSLG